MKLDRIKPCEPAAFASDLAMYCPMAGEYGAFHGSNGRGHQGRPAGRHRAGQSVRRALQRQEAEFAREQFETVRDMLGLDEGVSIIAKATGLSRQTIYRIKDDAAGSEAALLSWGR